MPVSLNEIVLSLPKLKLEELIQLKKRIDAYLALGSGGSGPPLVGNGGAGAAGYSTDAVRSEVSDETFVLDIVCDTHFKLNGGTYTSAMLRKQAATMSSLRNHLPGLLHYLKNVDKVQRKPFLALCVEMLYHNLQHLKLPANPPMLVKHLARIPSLVDTHFPSYAKNGLLRHIIRMK